jgi:hypothetical protein
MEMLISFTVTVQVAVLLPSTVLTFIAAVPGETAVTLPLLTVATDELLLAHVTAAFVALLGATVAISVSDPPTECVSVDLFNDTPVTATFLSPPPPQAKNPASATAGRTGKAYKRQDQQ